MLLFFGMLSISCSQVIQLLDGLRFILKRQKQDLQLFVHRSVDKGNDKDFDYWNVISFIFVEFPLVALSELIKNTV